MERKVVLNKSLYGKIKQDKTMVYDVLAKMRWVCG
jgi:hypothetical protein